MIRVGCIVDSLVPSVRDVLRGAGGVSHLVSGRGSGSAVDQMRFQWIARELATTVKRHGVVYERYRPWRSYAAVVFLKSMGRDVAALRSRLGQRGVKTVFDCNVDYVTPARGTFYYDGMAPTEEQRRDALEMIGGVDGVVGDSEHLTAVCRALHSNVRWIPDNVRMDLVPKNCHPSGSVGGRLRVLWSGTSRKAFELLAVEALLRSHRQRIELVVVTDGLGGMDKIYEPHRTALRELLHDVDARVLPFTGIEDLLRLYAEGGVFFSPRHLDNSYNQGHTEWKITLPLACGRRVLCADQASYRTVAERGPGTVAVCRNDDEWRASLEECLDGNFDWARQVKDGHDVVAKCYATSVVARQFVDFMVDVLNQTR